MHSLISFLLVPILLTLESLFSRSEFISRSARHTQNLCTRTNYLRSSLGLFQPRQQPLIDELLRGQIVGYPKCPVGNHVIVSLTGRLQVFDVGIVDLDGLDPLADVVHQNLVRTGHDSHMVGLQTLPPLRRGVLGMIVVVTRTLAHQVVRPDPQGARIQAVFFDVPPEGLGILVEGHPRRNEEHAGQVI